MVWLIHNYLGIVNASFSILALRFWNIIINKLRTPVPKLSYVERYDKANKSKVGGIEKVIALKIFIFSDINIEKVKGIKIFFFSCVCFLSPKHNLQIV